MFLVINENLFNFGIKNCMWEFKKYQRNVLKIRQCSICFCELFFLISGYLMFVLYLLIIGYKNKMIRSCVVVNVNRVINKKLYELI